MLCTRESIRKMMPPVNDKQVTTGIPLISLLEVERNWVPAAVQHPFQRMNHQVDLLVCIVKGQGGTHGSRNIESRHCRLGAVMSRAHGDAFSVQIPADVLGLITVNDEGQRSNLVECVADVPKTFDR